MQSQQNIITEIHEKHCTGTGKREVVGNEVCSEDRDEDGKSTTESESIHR